MSAIPVTASHATSVFVFARCKRQTTRRILPFLVLLGAVATTPAQLQPGPNAPSATPAMGIVPDTGGPAEYILQAFWSKAWAVPLKLGESGTLLSETPTPKTWQIAAVDTSERNPFVAEGVFMETDRLPLPSLTITPDLLAQMGVVSADFDIVVGTVVGSTGAVIDVFGMSAEKAFLAAEPDGSLQVVRSFIVFGMGNDLAAVQSDALAMWNEIEGVQPLMLVQLQDCQQIYDDCMDKAWNKYMDITAACILPIFIPPFPPIPKPPQVIAACELANFLAWKIDRWNCQTEEKLCEGI